MTRLEANREILKVLSQVVERYPDFRFNQLLVGIELISTNYDETLGTRYWNNEFYTESTDILERITNEQNKLWNL
jgi:hypothetical protein